MALTSFGLLNTTTGNLGAYIDANGQFVGSAGYAGRSIYEDFNGLATTDQISLILPSGATAAGLAQDALALLYTPTGNVFGVRALGGAQTLPPTIVAAGLDIGGDQTFLEGYLLFSHWAGATGRPFCVGKDPAFFFECEFQVTVIDGTDTLFVGFRRAESVTNNVLANFADYAGVGFNTAANPGDIKLISKINGSAPASYPKDTTQNLASAAAITVKVLVSAAGVITYTINGAAPTETAAATFDTGDPVIPVFHFLNNFESTATGVIIHSWKAGYQ